MPEELQALAKAKTPEEVLKAIFAILTSYQTLPNEMLEEIITLLGSKENLSDEDLNGIIKSLGLDNESAKALKEQIKTFIESKSQEQTDEKQMPSQPKQAENPINTNNTNTNTTDTTNTGIPAVKVISDESIKIDANTAITTEKTDLITKKADITTEKTDLITKKADITTEKTDLTTKKADITTENKTIKDALAHVVKKVLNHLNLQSVPGDKTEVTVKVNLPSENAIANADENSSILEKIQILQKIAPENLENIELKVSTDKTQLQSLTQELKQLLTNISNLLNNEITQNKGDNVDIQKLNESLGINLSNVLNNAKETQASNILEVIVPKLINKLNQVSISKPVDTPAPKALQNLLAARPDVKIDTELDQEAEVSIERLKVSDEAKNAKNSQLDRSINLSKSIMAEPALTTKSKAQNIIQSLKESIAEREAILKEKSILSDSNRDNRGNNNNNNQNSDFTSKNVFNMLLNKTTDPALAGIKANSITNNFVTGLNNITQNFNTTETTKTDSVVNQVIEKIRNNLTKSELTVSLRPANLGTVNVNVVLHKGVLVANIVAESVKAYEALKSDVSSLRQVLVENGFNVERIVVSASEQSNQANNSNHNESNSGQNKGQENASNSDQNEKSPFKQALQSGQENKSNTGSNNNSMLRNNPNDEKIETNVESANSNNKTEENYIDTEKGFVNYRV